MSIKRLNICFQQSFSFTVQLSFTWVLFGREEMFSWWEKKWKVLNFVAILRFINAMRQILPQIKLWQVYPHRFLDSCWVKQYPVCAKVLNTPCNICQRQCAVKLERMKAFIFWSQGQDKESTETVEARKVKEEKLEVAGGKCWRGKWLSALCLTGEIFKRFPCNEGRICNYNIGAKESAAVNVSVHNVTMSLPWYTITVSISGAPNPRVCHILSWNSCMFNPWRW